MIHVQASYIAKVEKVVKIKQKQDEDKAAAKLHSLKLVSQQTRAYRYANTYVSSGILYL